MVEPFDTAARKSCRFDDAIARERYERMVAAQRKLPIPEWLGGSVGIRRK